MAAFLSIERERHTRRDINLSSHLFLRHTLIEIAPDEESISLSINGRNDVGKRKKSPSFSGGRGKAFCQGSQSPFSPEYFLFILYQFVFSFFRISFEDWCASVWIAIHWKRQFVMRGWRGLRICRGRKWRIPNHPKRERTTGEYVHTWWDHFLSSLPSLSLMIRIAFIHAWSFDGCYLMMMHRESSLMISMKGNQEMMMEK